MALAVVQVGLACSLGACRPARGPDEAPLPLWQVVPYERLPAPAAASGRAPFTLTATDGTGLELSRVEARAVVEGPLAFTELHLRFHNPSERVLEGTFELTLPPGATVGRFAMEIGGTLVEAEVVERLAAAQVYESYKHQRVDPAELTAAVANVFRARVFPIPPNADKYLILSYTHELEQPDAPFVLPLRGLPYLDELRADITLAGARRGRSERARYLVHKEGFQPDRDVVIGAGGAVAAPNLAGVRAVRGGNAVVLRLVPEARGGQPEPLDELLVLVDTSASRAADFAAHVGELSALLQALPERSRVEVLAFDQEVAPIYAGTARGFGAAHREALSQRMPLGATDFSHALEVVAARGRRTPRILLLTDGIVTAGGIDRNALDRRISALGSKGLGRVDTWLTGAARDEAVPVRLISAAPRPGAVFEDPEKPSTVARGLAERLLPPVRVQVDGATFTYPESLKGLRAGSAGLVYAESNAYGPVRVRWAVPGDSWHEETVMPLWVAPPLAERAVAGARIRKLTGDYDSRAEDATRSRMARNIARISVEHRVLSRFTSLLVLESEEEYARWGIRRDALPAILEWQDGVVAQRGRSPNPWSTMSGQSAPALAPGHTPGEIRALRIPANADGDGDGIPDGEDACPTEPGAANATAASNGCPRLLKINEDSDIVWVEPVQYESGSARIRPESYPVLDEIAEFLKVRPNLRVGIYGHTDPRGDPRENRALSQRRADAVKGYLVKKGIRADRLEAAGLGADKPRALEDTPEARKANRRTDFRVLSDDGTVLGQPALSPRQRPPRLGHVGVRRPARVGPLAELAVAIETNPSAAMPRLERHNREHPADLQGLLLLGEAYAVTHEPARAARAYGSLLDLFAGAPDVTTHAATRLEQLGSSRALELAAAAYARALAQRPDRPLAYRNLAYAKLAQRDHAGSLDALRRAFEGSYAPNAFGRAREVLKRDLSLIGAANLGARPAEREEILRVLARHDATPATEPELLVTLSWESDGNEVGLVASPAPPSGSQGPDPNELAGGARVLTDAPARAGYGPVAVVFEKERSYPVHLGAYYARPGPAGDALGRVHVVDFDGTTLRTRSFPFVFQREYAFAWVGTLTAPLRD